MSTLTPSEPAALEVEGSLGYILVDYLIRGLIALDGHCDLKYSASE